MAFHSALADIFTHTTLHVAVVTTAIAIIVSSIYSLRKRHSTGASWGRRLILLTLPLPLLMYIVQPWQLIPLAPHKSTETTTTKILVWNMYLMNYDAESVEALIRKHDPDIVALIECNPDVGNQLSEIRKSYSSFLWELSGGRKVSP